MIPLNVADRRPLGEVSPHAVGPGWCMVRYGRVRNVGRLRFLASGADLGTKTGVSPALYLSEADGRKFIGEPVSDAATRQVEWIRAAVAKYERPLTSYALKLLGNLDLARDVVQDVFLRLCDQPAGKLDNYLVEWLYTVCRNRALDVREKEQRRRHLGANALRGQVDDLPRPAVAAQTNEAVAEMLRQLEQLPDNQKEVLRLRFQHGLAYRQIADVTGLTVSYVGWLIHTGLKNLRANMEDSYGQEVG